MVVAAPNYATNIVTPRAIGADLELLELRFEDGYRLDLDRLAAMIRPDTAFVSLTCPHNPTGTMLGLDEIDAVIDLVEAAAPAWCWTRPTATWAVPSRCRSAPGARRR